MLKFLKYWLWDIDAPPDRIGWPGIAIMGIFLLFCLCMLWGMAVASLGVISGEGRVNQGETARIKSRTKWFKRMSSDTPGIDHRRQHRQRVLKGAAIITGIQNSEIRCSVKNQHDKGAELRVAPDARIPDRFLLYVHIDSIAYRCVVRWRRNDRIGVEFTGTEPKPKLHYG